MPVQAAAASCVPLDDLVKSLDKDFGEQIIQLGDTPKGPVNVYVNPKTRTWTIAFEIVGMASKRKIGCIVAAGTNFRFAPTGGTPL